jgi:hypothetical protein
MVNFILPEASTQYSLMDPEAILDVAFKGKIIPLMGIKQNVQRLNFCNEMSYMIEKLNLGNSWQHLLKSLLTFLNRKEPF